MKRKLSFVLSLCLCASALFSTAGADVVNSTDTDSTTSETQTVSTFPDVPASASYAEAVNALHEYGIISGDSKGNFNPSSSITRAEAAAIICRLSGIDELAKQASTTAFSDVPVSHWSNGYVATAAKQGIINGYGNGRFGPSDSVTYAQIVKMLVCTWDGEDAAVAAGGWPTGYITVAQNRNYLKGLTITDYKYAAPRSDVAVLIYNSFISD